jgi:hypothetical protein
MELTPTEFNQMLSNVTKLHIDEETLRLLSIMAKSIETSESFVSALLTSQSPPGKKDSGSVYGTMRILETLADKIKPIGCILMAHLYQIADALFMHDVCNAIDLWVADCNSPELKLHLRKLVSYEKDDDLRRHYEQMSSQ